MSILNILQQFVNHPLTHRNPTKAILRFLIFQIRSRLIRKPIIHDWLGDVRFYVRTGETGLTGNIYVGLHEFNEMAFLLFYLGAKDLFIDVGANSGSYTLLACGVKGARGYAFEPDLKSFKRLKENVRLNHLERKVKILNVGIGNKKCFQIFTKNEDTTNHVINANESAKAFEKIQVATLNSLLINENPTMMKIDVEGYEYFVLKGALKILNKASLKVVILEMNGISKRYGYQENNIMKIMKSYNFLSYSFNPFNRQLSLLNGKNYSGNNTLFIRDKAQVIKAVKNSSGFEIFGTKL